MSIPAKQKDLQPSIKTPQELVHIKHKISLRQYKYWIIVLRAYRKFYEEGIPSDEDEMYRVPVAQLTELMGYDPVRSELRADLEALRKEPIIYNILGKDKKAAQRGVGFISEWEVSANWLGFKLPRSLMESVERLDDKNSIFHPLNWAVFNSFSGKYEAILYKLCKDYVGVGGPPHMTIARFREYMGLSETEYAEFKDLNKYVITGPVKKLNESEIADITIEVKLKKESRRVVGLDFVVALRRQAVFGFMESTVFGNARVTISPAQQTKYLADKKPEEIALSIERANAYAEEQEQKGKPINLGAIYQQAITQDWGLEYKSKLVVDEAKAKKKSRAATSHAAAPTSDEPPADPAANHAMAQFEALPPADRSRTLERFAETLKGPLKKTYDIQGLGSPIIRGSLAGWLARGG
jgi:hypothetical protein